jgi:hypothetical protein
VSRRSRGGVEARSTSGRRAVDERSRSGRRAVELEALQALVARAS